MLTTKTWLSFILLTALLLGAGYQQILSGITASSNQQEIEANQRIAEKVDGNMDALESNIRVNDLVKAKAILQGLSKNEHIVCSSILIGTQTISYPDSCNVAQSDRTIVVGSVSGAVVKIDTGLTLADELKTKINLAFLVLGLGFFGILGLFAILFTMAFHWMKVKGEGASSASFFFKTPQ